MVGGKAETAGQAGKREKTDVKKRSVRIGGCVKRRRKKRKSVALGQIALRRARPHGQHCGTANTDEQRTEEHGNATQQRKAGGGAEDLADGKGCKGSTGGLE